MFRKIRFLMIANTIEQLAALFAAHVVPFVRNHGGRPVDIIAHSMGGLVARAWMAGLAAPLPGQTATLAYSGEIRRLILIGTPNYGAEIKALFRALTSTGFVCNDTQAAELRFGSSFVSKLHDAWQIFQSGPLGIAPINLLYIAGTRDTDRPVLNWECENVDGTAYGCSDGVVEISSAVLPDSTDSVIRYVPYKHTPAIPQPPTGWSIADVTDTTHKSYQIISQYLLTGTVMSQCCGGGTVDYNPPHFRSSQDHQTGLLLVRMNDQSTGTAMVGQTPTIAFTPAPPTSPQSQANGQTALTFWGLDSGTYNLTITSRRYQTDAVNGVQTRTARPTVPATQMLMRSK